MTTSRTLDRAGDSRELAIEMPDGGEAGSRACSERQFGASLVMTTSRTLDRAGDSRELAIEMPDGGEAGSRAYSDR